MPASILNLKFKGNKSFVAFSNLADSDSLTKTWKVCTKVAAYLEQGQRLENLSWRLWHLQNLIVDTDNARSKREFKKLSKNMGDKLDKEKGRSISELEAPDFKSNTPAVEKLRLRAEEKERSRQDAATAEPGRPLRRMQFTFAVDAPPVGGAGHSHLSGPGTGDDQEPPKLDFRPSSEFRDNVRRNRPTAKQSQSAPIVQQQREQDSSGSKPSEATAKTTSSTSRSNEEDKDPPSLTELGRKPSPQPRVGFDSSGGGNSNWNLSAYTYDHALGVTLNDIASQNMNTNERNSNSPSAAPALRFPTLFNSDFRPSALLLPQPSLAAGLSYGEDTAGTSVQGYGRTADTFKVPRPTIELPLDELLRDISSADNQIDSRDSLPSYATNYWNSDAYDVSSVRGTQSGTSGLGTSGDIDMNVDYDFNQTQGQTMTIRPSQVSPPTNQDPVFSSPETDLAQLQSPTQPTRHTRTPSLPAALPTMSSLRSLTSDTSSSRSGGAGTSSFSGMTSRPRAASSAGTGSAANRSKPSLTVRTSSTHTPSVSNAKKNAPAPPPTASTINPNSSGPGGVKAECVNCGATHTPLWRRGLNDELNCNACGLYCKLHKRPRPKSMRNQNGEGRNHSAPKNDSADSANEPAQCYNCHTTATPLWRKDDEGKTVCNACGLYFKLHGSSRPISMKSDIIRKRSRAESRRNSVDSPSASPGASRRASPSSSDGSAAAPALESSTLQQQYEQQFEQYQKQKRESQNHQRPRTPQHHEATTIQPEYSYAPEDYEFTAPSSMQNNNAQHDLMSSGMAPPPASGERSNRFTFNAHGAGVSMSSGLGASGSSLYGHGNLNSCAFEGAFSNFPGPYHPDYVRTLLGDQTNNSSNSSNAFSHVPGDEDERTSKRRRMSESSFSEPPSSATSYTTYASGMTDNSHTSATTAGSAMGSSFNSYHLGHSSAGSSHMSSSAGSYGGFPSFTDSGLPLMRTQQAFAHPPMLPQLDKSPASFVHPPMLPTTEHDTSYPFSATTTSANDFLHPPMIWSGSGASNSVANNSSSNGVGNTGGSGGSSDREREFDLFASYLHPPMVPARGSEDSPLARLSTLHPPMLVDSWSYNSNANTATQNQTQKQQQTQQYGDVYSS